MGSSYQFRDHYADVTNKIIEALEVGGLPPWRKPWGSSASFYMNPQNAVTGRSYRGINVLLLGMSEFSETEDPRWCSYKQAQSQKGWKIKRGSKATTIYFFKVIDDNEKLESCDAGVDDDERAVRAVLRSYPIFHASQIDGIEPFVGQTLDEAYWKSTEAVDIISKGIDVRHGGNRAYYNPQSDRIAMPQRGAFESAELYSSTLLHEIAHWSGHKSRLNRDFTGKFGSHAYAIEELIADLGGVMVATRIGVNPDLKNHASYAESWLRALREDSSKRTIFKCAAQSQKIADLLLSRHPLFTVRADYQSTDAGTRALPQSDKISMPRAEERSATLTAAQIASMPAHMRRTLGLDPKAVAAPLPPTLAPAHVEELASGPRFR